MKTIVYIVFVILFHSCNSFETEPTVSFSIQTEDESYLVNNKLSIKITFINRLGKEINIHNSGCFFPSFTIERFEDGKWKTEGGPVCVAIAVPPKRLANEEQYESIISMYVENNIVTGTYRMKFDIREPDSNNMIESHYLYSNTFQIIKQ